MAKSLKEIFDKECVNLKIDNRFVRQLLQYEKNYVNSSEDYIEFLGGYLLGAPPFRFHDSDRNSFFDEVVQIDDRLIQTEILNHFKEHDLVIGNVRSNVFNLTCAYISYRIRNSKLSVRMKEDALLCLFRVLHYRFLGSLMAWYMKHPPDRRVLEATYAALNRKFALKQHGSWGKLIEARSKDIISDSSIHKKTIDKFDDDVAAGDMVADIQGRIREVVKKIYRVFMEVHKSGMGVVVRSSTIDLDGNLHVRDLTRRFGGFKRYAHEVFEDRNTLIRTELVKVISDAMHTMPERHLVTTLEYMSDNYGRRGDANVAKLIEETMLHAIDFITANHKEFSRHISLTMLLQRLRALYTSSRSSDPSLLKMRDYSLKIAKKAVKSNNPSLLASIRTGMMLYIVLRTFSMNYYTSGSLESDRIMAASVNNDEYISNLIDQLDNRSGYDPMMDVVDDDFEVPPVEVATDDLFENMF